MVRYPLVVMVEQGRLSQEEAAREMGLSTPPGGGVTPYRQGAAAGRATDGGAGAGGHSTGDTKGDILAATPHHERGQRRLDSRAISFRASERDWGLRFGPYWLWDAPS